MDMRDAAPWNVYRPHLGQVEAVVLFRHVLFSSGDRCVLGSDIHTGETLGRITRDSGKIPILMVIYLNDQIVYMSMLLLLLLILLLFVGKRWSPLLL
jgi:hypothetical protein